MAIVFWGWRYGWAPLPEPPEGPWIEALRLEDPAPGTLEAARAAAASPWPVWRRLAAGFDAEVLREDGEDIREAWITGWARGEPVPPLAIEVTTRWLAFTAEWDEALETLLAAPPAWPDGPVREEFGPWVRHVETRLLVRAMNLWPGPQSDVALTNRLQAMETLVRWMEFNARLMPFSLWPGRFDERASEELEDTGLAAWEWMVAAAPPIPPDLRRQWRERLERAARQLPGFEAIYPAVAAEAWQLWEQYRSDGVRRRFRLGWNRATMSLANWWSHCRRALGALGGGDQSFPSPRHLWPGWVVARFRELLAEWLRFHCARPADARRLFTIGAARVLQAGAEGRNPLDVWRAWFDRAEEPGWWNRPGAWQVARYIPSPHPAWEEPRWWRTRLLEAA
ncbi:MAG: hypothetical protein D6766_09125, partial [Verrucomicrobia bacterium]